jgi:uncharacterized membrane protein YbhN (UPF0104 family)
VAAALTQRRLGLLNVAVSAAAVAGIAWWATRQRAPHVPLRGVALAELAGAVALYGLVTVLRGERWHRILERNGLRRRRRASYGLTVVGYMGNNTLPARAGDVMRVLLVGGSRRVALGTVLAERLLDVLALAVLFVAVVLTRGLDFGPLPYVAAAAAVALAAGAVALKASHKLSQAIRPVAAASQGLLSVHGLALLGLSLLLWTGEAAVYLAVGYATDVHLGIDGALYVVALTNLSALLPAAPGYVGTFDAAVLLALRSLHLPALGYLLVLRFVLFVPITIAGAAVYFARYARRKR